MAVIGSGSTHHHLQPYTAPGKVAFCPQDAAALGMATGVGRSPQGIEFVSELTTAMAGPFSLYSVLECYTKHFQL